MTANNPEAEERIRKAAASTDKLIARLDSLAGRIDSARSKENQDLAEYYERQFAEASVEFMDGVESILDDWYALKGETRPSPDEERIEPDTLEAIHKAVVSIVHGESPEIPDEPARAEPVQAALEAGDEIAPQPERPVPAIAPGPRHKVDIKG